MTIDRLGGMNPLEKLNGSSKVTPKNVTSVKSDSIAISDEAREMAELYHLAEIAKDTPDVRADLVAQMKERIKDASFLSPANIAATADRIMESLGY